MKKVLFLIFTFLISLGIFTLLDPAASFPWIGKVGCSVFIMIGVVASLAKHEQFTHG